MADLSDDNGALDPDRYWAALPAKFGMDQPADGLAAAVIDHVNDYYDTIEQNGMLWLWRRVYAAYYGLSETGEGHEGSEVTFGGKYDERVLAKSNQLRSIMQYLLVTTVASRPQFNPRAENTDADSQAQVPLARNALEYYMREKRLERVFKSVVERSLLYGQGYLWVGWDPGAGPEFTPDVDEDGEPTGASIHEGDLVAKAFSPMDVPHDTTREQGNHDWYVITDKANRFELAARYGKRDKELREEILRVAQQDSEMRYGTIGDGSLNDRMDYSTDDVRVYHFVHARTEAIPDGRYTICLSSDVVLFDGPLPYEGLPVYEMAPSEFLETGFGYASAWDLLGLQDIYDAMLSTAVSAADAHGVANVIGPENAEVDVEELRDGLNYIKVPPGMTDQIQPLNLLDIDKAIFDIAEWVKNDMETIPGVNSVARGEPEASLKSGAALALVQAQAIHFNSGLQAAFFQLLEDAGTGIVRILKAYAKAPRLISIVGLDQSEAVSEFKGEDIESIDRVVIDVGNPLMRTTAGRLQIADSLLERGLIKRPETYLQLLETGRLEPTMRADQRAIQRITQENEALRQAPPVIEVEGGRSVEGLPVMMTDNPALHVPEHAAELASLQAVNDPDRVTAVTTHINEHIRVWLETPPEVLAMLQIPTPQMVGVAPPQAGGQAPPPGEGPEGVIEGPQAGELPNLPSEAQPTVEPNALGAGGAPAGMPGLPAPAQNPMEGMS